MYNYLIINLTFIELDIMLYNVTDSLYNRLVRNNNNRLLVSNTISCRKEVNE